MLNKCIIIDETTFDRLCAPKSNVCAALVTRHVTRDTPRPATAGGQANGRLGGSYTRSVAWPCRAPCHCPGAGPVTASINNINIQR